MEDKHSSFNFIKYRHRLFMSIIMPIHSVKGRKYIFQKFDYMNLIMQVIFSDIRKQTQNRLEIYKFLKNIFYLFPIQYER